MADVRRSLSLTVTVSVAYGAAGLPGETRRVELPGGTTVLDATRAAVPVTLGFVCCDDRDVAAIRGVACDPAARRWWYYGLNGAPGPASAHRQPVADGDRIEWRYLDEAAWRREPWPGG